MGFWNHNQISVFQEWVFTYPEVKTAASEGDTGFKVEEAVTVVLIQVGALVM